MATDTKSKEAKDQARILTPEFRVSYPHLFKPSVMKGTNNAPKYSVVMLFDKAKDLNVIKKAMTQAKTAKFGPDKANWPEVKSPVTDGDLPKYADKEGYKGHWAIKASTNEEYKPAVMAENAEDEITNPADFYPGCYARAQVYAFVWEFPKGSGSYGLSFTLDCIQKTKDGKSFGGKKDARQIFTPIGTGEDVEVETEEMDFR